MQEFDSVSVSSYEAETLSAKLGERSVDGWSVVGIVAAGSDIVAYLSRQGSETSSYTDSAAGADTGAAAASATPAEPAGWGATSTGGETAAAAPAGSSSWGSDSGSSTDTSTSDTAGSGASSWGGDTSPGGAQPAAGTSSWGSDTASTSGGSSWGTGAAAGASSAASSSPSVPAGWYADPSSRFELRYWDGSAWTEHVSRGGQQYTDPPVA